jgi:hypothetical protein
MQGKSPSEIVAARTKRVRDDITSYVRAKLSPLVGLPVTFKMGKNVVGEDAYRQHEVIPVNAELIGAVAPMVGNTIMEAWIQGEKRKESGEYPMGGWGYVLSAMPADFTGSAQVGVYPSTDSHGNPKRLKAMGEARPERPKPPSKFDAPVVPPGSLTELLRGRPKQ